MKIIGKFLFLVFILSFLIYKTPVVYSADVSPSFNPICWQEQECKDAREKLTLDSSEDSGEGFIKGIPPCDKGDWGVCLPAGKSKTSISLGGKSEFSDIGDYIKTVYNYALSIASILAVIMIILAGVQWMTSGGNSERITSSKKRIVGALVGLTIAYLSFVILNSINPSLVNLRLPQTYMIKSFKVTPEFCSAVPKDTLLSLAAKANEQSKDVAPTAEVKYNLQYLDTGDNKDFKCGARFFIKDSGASVCTGDICQSGKVCVNFNPLDKNNPYHCIKATVAGTITYGNALERAVSVSCLNREGWEFPDITDEGEQELWIICKNKTFGSEVSSFARTINQKKSQNYLIVSSQDDISSAIEDCGGESLVRGFYLKFEMNEDCDPKDENHWIGKDGVDLGDDRFFVDNISNIKDEFFISIDDIKKGLTMSFDAKGIIDIDEPVQRKAYENLLN